MSGINGGGSFGRSKNIGRRFLRLICMSRYGRDNLVRRARAIGLQRSIRYAGERAPAVVVLTL